MEWFELHTQLETPEDRWFLLRLGFWVVWQLGGFHSFTATHVVCAHLSSLREAGTQEPLVDCLEMMLSTVPVFNVIGACAMSAERD